MLHHASNFKTKMLYSSERQGNHMQIDIIIPTMLKKPEYLQKCLESLQKVHTSHNLNLFVVGNVSQQELYAFRDSFDATRFEVTHKKRAPIVFHWRALGKNYGFTGAVNEGARLGTSPLIVLLNDDTQVTPNWLDLLIATQTATSSSMIASQILLANSKKIDSLGFTFLWRGKAVALQDVSEFSNGHTQLAQLPSDHWMKFPELLVSGTPAKTKQLSVSEPFGPDAAAALYTREVWEQLDGMNSSFFAYLEDVDFALRARLLGYTCSLASEAIVFHHKHATSTHFSGFKAKQDFFNWWRIVLGSYPKQAWVNFAFTILLERLRNFSGLVKRTLVN